MLSTVRTEIDGNTPLTGTGLPSKRRVRHPSAGINRVPRSAMATFAPRAWQIVANSTPTGPPPTMRMSSGARPRYRIVSVSQTPGMSNEMFFGRRGRDPVAIRIVFALELALTPIAAGDHDGAVSQKRTRALDVVDMIPGDILRRCSLQKAANVPGPLADDVGCNLRRRRRPQTVDTAFDKARRSRAPPLEVSWSALRPSWLRFHLAAPSQSQPSGDRRRQPIRPRFLRRDRIRWRRSHMHPSSWRPLPSQAHCIWSSISEKAFLSLRAFLISSAVTYGYSPYSRKLGH